jgi:hypothetical protein
MAARSETGLLAAMGRTEYYANHSGPQLIGESISI